MASAVFQLMLASLVCILVSLHTSGEKEIPWWLPDECVIGHQRKDRPTPESDDFVGCLPWKQHSCCTAEVANSIHDHRAVELYNYHWDLCGNLSASCERYMKSELCFYQCEPMLKYFEFDGPEEYGFVKHVPICANYCEEWFEACKDDKTCVVDWLADFVRALDYENSCPESSECRTFAETYGDAKGMCDRMWHYSFKHHNGSEDCFVMDFDGNGTNPNILWGEFAVGSAVVSMVTVPYLGLLMLIYSLWF